jgi:hypothetical protein
LRELAAARHADVPVLGGSIQAVTPPNMPFASDNLRALTPDVADRDV